MPKIRSITRLKRKRAEIAASIKLHEKQLAQARSDLAHVEATMRIFPASGKPQDISRHVKSTGYSSGASLGRDCKNETQLRFRRCAPRPVCSANLHGTTGIMFLRSHDR